jgi:hypothetical protein
MKEINEYWQMRIFDLLEGNLNEQEKQHTLNAIEGDAALKKEYELLRNTYLEPENFIFENKQSLYKKENKFIYYTVFKKYTVAASFIILFGSIAIFWFSRNNNASGTITAVNNSEKIDATKPEKSVITSNNAQNDITKNQNINHHNYWAPGYVKSFQKDTAIPIIYAPSHVGDPEIEIKKSPIIAKTDVIQSENDTFIPVQMKPNVAGVLQDLPVANRKKRSLGYKLLNNSRQMFANLILPEIRFKTEKKTNSIVPRIKMEISTPKTEIIATLID